MVSEAEMAERLYGNTAPAASLPSPEVEMAERLFGKPQQSAPNEQANSSASAEAPPAAERTPLTEQEMIYGKAEELPEPNLPPEIKELRESDPSRKMLSPQGTFAEVLPDNALAETELDAGTQAAAMHEFRELAADLDLAPNDVRGMISRASMLGHEPRDPAAQREEAARLLNSEFGQGAHQAWQDARTLVARDPRVGQIIDALGLGDDPQTVMLLAHAARRQRIAGRLK